MDSRKRRRRAQIDSGLGNPDPVMSRDVRLSRDFTEVSPALRHPSVEAAKSLAGGADPHPAELAEALGSDWGDGKRRLYRSALTGHFRTADPKIAGFCMDAEEAVRRDRTRDDAEFFKLLYRMSPGMRSLHWKRYHFPSMNGFGYALMRGLDSSDRETLTMADDMMQNRIFSAREGIVNPSDPSRFKALSAAEGKYILAKDTADEWTQMEQLYLLAYYYSQTKSLETSLKAFQSVEELAAFARRIAGSDPDRLDLLSEELMMDSAAARLSRRRNPVRPAEARPAPRFAAWLTLYGKRPVSQV